MAAVDLDLSEVATFAAELKGVPSELSRHAIPALKRFAQDVKTDMQKDFRSSSNGGFQKIANFVRYDDLTPGAGGYETEVGVDKGGAGSLANLAVYGTPKGGGTHPRPDQIAVWHQPAYEKSLQDMAAEILS